MRIQVAMHFRACWSYLSVGLEVESHGGCNQAGLPQMSQIAAGALARNAPRAQGRPIVHICDVVHSDAPCAQFLEYMGCIADAKVEHVILGRISAVDVVDRAPPDVL